MDNPFVSALAPLVLVFVLALATEGIIEYLGVPLPSWLKPYVAAMLAVIVCLAYDADLLAIMGYQARWAEAGPILTGLVAGRGSNYLNTFWKRIQLVKTPAADVDVLTDEQRRLNTYLGPDRRSRL